MIWFVAAQYQLKVFIDFRHSQKMSGHPEDKGVYRPSCAMRRTKSLARICCILSLHSSAILVLKVVAQTVRGTVPRVGTEASVGAEACQCLQRL